LDDVVAHASAAARPFAGGLRDDSGGSDGDCERSLGVPAFDQQPDLRLSAGASHPEATAKPVAQPIW